MKRTETAVRKPEHALRRLIGSDVRDGETVEAMVTIAIVRDPRSEQQEAWMRPMAIRVTKRGETHLPPLQPIDHAYEGMIEGGLPLLPKSGFLRMNATVCANGELLIRPVPGSGTYVPAHEKVLDSQRWFENEDALPDMAKAYGCSSPDGMFQEHGEVVSVG